MDFPFNASGCCPACGDTTDDSLLCDACADMVRTDPRTFQASGAEAFIAREEQKVIENLCSARNAVTIDDLDFLAELKVEYGDCCGLESNCPPDIRIARDTTTIFPLPSIEETYVAYNTEDGHTYLFAKFPCGDWGWITHRPGQHEHRAIWEYHTAIVRAAKTRHETRHESRN
jgi:hypothetical protein